MNIGQDLQLFDSITKRRSSRYIFAGERQFRLGGSYRLHIASMISKVCGAPLSPKQMIFPVCACKSCSALTISTSTDGNVFETEKRFQHEVYASALAAAKAGPNPELAEGIAERVGHDIALVKLVGSWNGPLSALSLTEATDPVARVPADQPVMVAGFGSTHPKSGDIQPFTRSGEKYFASTPELLEVALPYVDPEKCRAEWPNAEIGKGQICAGFDKGRGKDLCNGDSGGPLVTLDEHLCPRQVGLVSWGPYPCAPDQKAYGVYTRISAFAPWLREHVPELK